MNETNNSGYVDYPLTKAEQTQFADAKHAAQLTYEHLAITQATEDELMPNCPSCGEFKTVSKSVFPEEGTHYCHGALCDIYWFTPVNERPFAKAWRLAGEKAMRIIAEEQLANIDPNFLSTPVRTIQDNGVTVRVEDDSRGIAAGIISEAAFQREANRLKDEEFFSGDQWTAEQLQHMTERYVKPMLDAQLKAEAEGYVGQFDPLTDHEISTLPWVKEGRFLYNAKCVNHEAHRTAVCDCPEPARERFTSVTSNSLAADEALDFVDCGKLTVNGPPVELSLQPRYRTLNHEFLRLMDEIGIYGEEKYGEESMAAKFKRGDFTRAHRTSDDQITDHAYNHLAEFDEGKLHDHFGTRKHQLAAAAFNAQMKYIFFINECRKEVA